MIKIRIFEFKALLLILELSRVLFRLTTLGIALRLTLRQSFALESLTLETWFLVLRRDQVVCRLAIQSIALHLALGQSFALLILAQDLRWLNC